VLLGCFATAPAGAEGRLDKIKADNAITLGVRQDAKPFSFLDGDGAAKGYSVSICEAVVRQIKAQLQLPDLEVKYALVTPENRFQRLANGEVDIECATTTYTLGRLDQAEFSLLIYVTGADLLVRKDSGIDGLSDVNGKEIGVVAGTTAEQDLRILLGAAGLTAGVTVLESYSELLASLETEEIGAAYGDRALLLASLQRALSPEALMLIGAQYSYEPYALVLPPGENELRHAVDRGLARIYRTAESTAIYEAWFGPLAYNADMQRLFRIQGLPD